MRENFLRRPQGFGQILADLVRVLGAVSVVVAAIWWSATDAGVLALALPALLIPRFLNAATGFDLVYGVTILVAAWSNVADLYTRVAGWDLVVHFACTGVIATVTFVALVRTGILAVPRTGRFSVPSILVLFTVLGLAASAVWEMIEWLGKTFISSDIFVTYNDTIGDMAIGAAGALVAGVLARVLPITRDDRAALPTG